MYLPSSTYRIQLNKEFTFQKLNAIIDYLYTLGISTVYASPVTVAAAGSMHGYDVTDPGNINPEIGTLEELQQISERLKGYGMNWLQDVVPNHMSFSMENTRLKDVLQRGARSPYYSYFDIDWHHPDSVGKVMIPVLGKEMKECIKAGEIQLAFAEDGFEIVYMDNRYPVCTSSFPLLAVYMKNNGLPEELIQSLTDLDKQSVHSSMEEWNEARRNWINTLLSDPDKKGKIDALVKTINSDTNILTLLLNEQCYKPVFWKLSESRMNYRRFFAVNSLISLRMQEEDVFNDYHSFLLYLYREGIIQGMRIDHIDGLYDPKEYLHRLKKETADDCYIIAEKILEYNEDIAREWNIQGTSGYEFLSFVNRLLTDKSGSEKLLSFYQLFTGRSDTYEDLVYKNKHYFFYDQMAGELDNLVRILQQSDLIPANVNWEQMKKALAALIAAFPVYRIYPDSLPLQEEAMELVEKAFHKACEKAPSEETELGLLKELFLKTDDALSVRKISFLRKLMQFTGPMAAKGVEDTTFYQYNPLIAHNEVGDAPSPLAVPIEEFHAKMISRRQNNPYSLNATSTHDTKRGEDARMRINVLAHLADEWISKVTEWKEMNKSFVQNDQNRQMPSANDEYFIYQSLLGSFPEDLKVTDSFLERTKGFIIKALREAKAETTYTQPDQWYEQSCVNFITSILNSGHGFLKSFAPFLEKVLDYASVYSLIQTTIKITAPGIPDIYQGCELWELSYVDPDNRRPVDYTFRSDLLNEIIYKEREETGTVFEFIRNKRKAGAEKLFTLWKLLALRKENNGLFLNGTYIPMEISNGKQKFVAYLRSQGDDHVLVVLPVGFHLQEDRSFETSWNDILMPLPEGMPVHWRNVFTNERIELRKGLSLSGVFTDFPVAVFQNIR